MELTWKDIKVIVTGADTLFDTITVGDVIDKGEEWYYSEVLRVYNEFKKHSQI